MKKLWCDWFHMWHSITWTITRFDGVKKVYEIQVCWDCGRQYKNGIER